MELREKAISRLFRDPSAGGRPGRLASGHRERSIFCELYPSTATLVPMGLFSRKPTFNTGHPGDDQLLGMLAKAPGGLEEPRHWIHYVYCGDAAGADALEHGAVAAGWTVRRVVPEYHGIVAERSDLAITPERTVEVREFFERLAASVPAGEYDGWEASAG